MSDRFTRQGQSRARSAERRYPDRCIIRRPKSTSGTHGGQKPASPEILAVDVPCKTEPASASEKQLAGATTSETALKVKMPAWQGETPIQIDATCELEIAARGALSAQVLKVVAPLPRRGLTLEVVGTYQS